MMANIPVLPQLPLQKRQVQLLQKMFLNLPTLQYINMHRSVCNVIFIIYILLFDFVHIKIFLGVHSQSSPAFGLSVRQDGSQSGKSFNNFSACYWLTQTWVSIRQDSSQSGKSFNNFLARYWLTQTWI
jgi:hypothetical protein